MTMIRVDEFRGMNEAVSPRNLGSQFATKAKNCRLESGALEPLMGPSATGESIALANAKTIYRYADAHWFAWADDVDIVKTPLAYDSTDHVCFTGDDFPRQTRNDIALGGSYLPNAEYRLGVPAPAAAPSVSISTQSSDADALNDDTYYIYTYVNSWGQEGPPSPVSSKLVRKDGATVRIEGLATAPSGAHNLGTGATKRIYRANTGSSTTAFQFVKEVSIATTTTTEAKTSNALGEVIESATWVAPPDDTTALYPTGQMLGLRALPNGVLVGFSGNTLCYSVPYLPHAWPVEYRYPISDTIVGIEINDSGVLVATDNRPFLAVGFDPTAISIIPLDESRPCASKRSLVDMGDYAIYASDDGLVGFEQGSSSLLTGAIFTPEQWSRFTPASIHAYRYKDSYVAFYSGETSGGFMFTPSDSESPFVEIDSLSKAGYFDPTLGKLTLLDSDNSLVLFDSGAALNATWASKDFTLPSPLSMSCAQVFAEGYPVTLKITRDSTTTTHTVSSAEPFRLSALRSIVVSFEIVTNKKVYGVAIAQSMTELANA